MTLYLGVFSDDGAEVEGWVFGHYSDFGYFRDTVASHVDASLYPLLMEHHDCDGSWEVRYIPDLRRELNEIASLFRVLPPVEIDGAFEHTVEYRVGAMSLYDAFHNVDGENIFQALDELCQVALAAERPIEFQ